MGDGDEPPHYEEEYNHGIASTEAAGEARVAKFEVKVYNEGRRML